MEQVEIKEKNKFKNKNLVILIILIAFMLLPVKVYAEHCEGLSCIFDIWSGNVYCEREAGNSPYWVATEIIDNLVNTDACEVDTGCDTDDINTARFCVGGEMSGGTTNPGDWSSCVADDTCADVCHDHACPNAAHCDVLRSQGRDACADGSPCIISHDWGVWPFADSNRLNHRPDS